MFNRLSMALSRTRLAIGIMALTYLTSLTAGVLMTHQGNEFALSYRDSLVSKAYRADPAAQANRAGAHLKAAAIDFSRNLGLVAIPETIGGLTLVMPIGMSLYRGWIGGIVSVDRRHHSRLQHARSAVYYLVTLALQLAGFTLASGGALHLGWAFIRKRGPFIGPSWFRFPRPALADVAALYILIVPLFAIGSLGEFLM